MAILTLVALYIFGMPTMKGYDGYGYGFWTFGLLFCGLIFGSIIYLIYRVFSGKWNNNIFMYCIAIMWLLVLITIRR